MTNRFDYFVMFAEMRTGSNFLEANLNALSSITCHGEAFNPHFAGFPNVNNVLGIDQDARDADPFQLLTAVKQADGGLHGFRYFHDHDPRVLDTMLQDPRCAKVILTRNPAESYVSWKIARATGQWKLTDMKRRKEGQAVFDAPEFDAHVQTLQAFQVMLMRQLQITGQTAFYIDYEDLQDLDVINGLARFLGVDEALPSLDTTLKKQNPAPLADKVSNFDEMSKALAGVDRFNLTRTPNFEPRRGPMVPSYVAAADAPLLYMPVRGGVEGQIEHWLADLDQAAIEDLKREMGQKGLRQWLRQTSGHRSFTVVRHPLKRAHSVFCRKILPLEGGFGQIRQTLLQRYKVPLPKRAEVRWTLEKHKAAFEGFLTFLKGNLAGQTPIRVDPLWCSQEQSIKGFAEIMVPDVILREDALERDLPMLAAMVGKQPPPFMSLEEDVPFGISEVADASIQSFCRQVYQRDYIQFGFKDL